MNYYDKDLDKIMAGMFFIKLSKRLRKVIHNVIGEKEEMYRVITYDLLNEKKEYQCKRVHLRTDLNIMNLFTISNEYLMIDLKYISYFEIAQVNE